MDTWNLPGTRNNEFDADQDDISLIAGEYWPPWSILVRVEYSFLLVQRWQVFSYQEEATSKQFCCQSREEPSSKAFFHRHRVA